MKTLNVSDIVKKIQNIVESANTITDKSKMEPYCKGFRFGKGSAIAIVKPGSLLEMWRVLQVSTANDLAVILQAANTGLTGGSTPDGDNYDRPIIVINTCRIDSIYLIDGGKQIIALPGSTLFDLENYLSPINREPHSVIGSSCIGSSIIGGVCNNSGGALVERGPAYTELSLFAKININGKLELINNLDINLGKTPEEILTNLELNKYSHEDILYSEKKASDNEYQNHVRNIDANTPSRYNNDKRRLYDASGCAGKIAVFAVRLDTFPAKTKKQVFYIGSNNPDLFEKIRRDFLSKFNSLPISGEYMDKDCYDICKKYGKDTFIIIKYFGTKKIQKLFSLKKYIDNIAKNLSFLPNNLSDKLLQSIFSLLPNHLPTRAENFRNLYSHHWIVEMGDDGIKETKEYLRNEFDHNQGGFFECTEKEMRDLFLHRFVSGNAINRYEIINKNKIGALATFDIALPRNEKKWLIKLPSEIESQIYKKAYYGHFFCHVMHQNYFLKKGASKENFKNLFLDYLDKRRAEYPAEHNVGHEYFAKPELINFYKKIDPTNSFNPGIGKTSKFKYWA